MTFRKGARLDASQVEDLRGRRVGARGMAVGGGGAAGLVVLVIMLLIGGGNANLGSLLDQTVGGGAAEPESTTLLQECKTGADANARDDCRIVGYVGSIQAWWTTAFKDAGRTYQPSKTRFFSGGIQTGCGAASSEVGPFYCPADKYVYIDLGFFDDLKTKFGATGGPFAQAYILAHEYGHHVQDILGLLNAGGGGQGRPASRCAPSSRPTAWPASGRTTRSRRATWSRSRRPRWRTPSMPHPRSATTGSRRSSRAA